MLKLLLCVVLISSTTLVGNWFSARLRRRRESISVIIETIKKMKTLIRFGGYEIFRVIQQCFNGVRGFEHFCNVAEDDIEFDSWWSDCVDNISSESALSKEDLILLKRFAEGLGVTDTEGQMTNCSLYCEMFSEHLKNAEEAESKKSRLYRILGFSLGCAVTLITL